MLLQPTPYRPEPKQGKLYIDYLFSTALPALMGFDLAGLLLNWQRFDHAVGILIVSCAFPLY